MGDLGSSGRWGIDQSCIGKKTLREPSHPPQIELSWGENQTTNKKLTFLKVVWFFFLPSLSVTHNAV